VSDPFVAEIRIVACDFAPRGWAFCDGQLLPVSQNTALFSLIGTIYGGDGESTTALPDLRERSPMHPGRGPGLTARRLGQKVGDINAGQGAVTSAGAGRGLDSDQARATQRHYADAPWLRPALGLNFVIALQGLYPSRS